MPHTAPTLLVPTREGRETACTFPSSAWLSGIVRIDVHGDTGTLRTADAESVAIVLHGTLDLFAGGSAWARRGARTTPFDGRPVAVYLPPLTPYGSSDGDGALLVASVRQAPIRSLADAREALARKPLLPLLGSGKAFDPTSGEWRPRETFPDSPEAILPRRIARLTTPGGTVVERVLGLDYKARGLCVDEASLICGAPLRFVPPQAPGYPQEAALWLEVDGDLTVDGAPVPNDGVPRALACSPDAMPELRLERGRAYALVVWAGAKPAT